MAVEVALPVGTRCSNVRITFVRGRCSYRLSKQTVFLIRSIPYVPATIRILQISLRLSWTESIVMPKDESICTDKSPEIYIRIHM